MEDGSATLAPAVEVDEGLSTLTVATQTEKYEEEEEEDEDDDDDDDDGGGGHGDRPLNSLLVDYDDVTDDVIVGDFAEVLEDRRGIVRANIGSNLYEHIGGANDDDDDDDVDVDDDDDDAGASGRFRRHGDDEDLERGGRRLTMFDEWLEDASLNQPVEFEYEEVTIKRADASERIGLTLCYGSTFDDVTDVYVREVDSRSPAGKEGRIKEGDQIIQDDTPAQKVPTHLQRPLSHEHNEDLSDRKGNFRFSEFSSKTNSKHEIFQRMKRDRFSHSLALR